MLIEPVVLAIKSGVPGPTNETQRVVFDVRYGKPLHEGDPAPDRFGTINIPLDAIKSFEPGGGSVLELAETYDDGSGASAEAALKSCQEGSVFVADSPHFCGLVIAAAIR